MAEREFREEILKLRRNALNQLKQLLESPRFTSQHLQNLLDDVGQDYQSVVRQNANKKEAVYDIVRHAESDGWLPILLEAIIADFEKRLDPSIKETEIAEVRAIQAVLAKPAEPPDEAIEVEVAKPTSTPHPPIPTPSQNSSVTPPAPWWESLWAKVREVWDKASLWKRVVIVAVALAASFFVLACFAFEGDVWVREDLDLPEAALLHRTENMLVVGANVVEKGCPDVYTALRYRLLDGDLWNVSELEFKSELLCIQNWPGGAAFSDITALASPADAPKVVYALTSHSGVLISQDKGVHFSHFADPPFPFPAPGGDNLAYRLALSRTTPLELWVAGESRGLWRLRAGESVWERFDRPGLLCGEEEFPFELRATTLLATEQALLIGTDQQGLWLVSNDDASCRKVYDETNVYLFLKLVEVPDPQHPGRFLALVNQAAGVNTNTRHLLDFCPREAACPAPPEEWKPDIVLEKREAFEELLVQGREGDFHWYLVEQNFGQVWHGTLSAPGREQTMSPIFTCLSAAFTTRDGSCRVALAPSAPGAMPYLLAAGHVYHYGRGKWWRWFWP